MNLLLFVWPETIKKQFETFVLCKIRKGGTRSQPDQTHLLYLCFKSVKGFATNTGLNGKQGGSVEAADNKSNSGR